jgi:hypothetical protein
MEKENNLFNYRTFDGFPLWDIIRYNAYLSINTNIQNANLRQRRRINFLKIALSATKHFLLFFKLFTNKSTFIYCGLSRMLNENGELYDPFFNSIKNFIPPNTIFFEKSILFGKYSKENRLFDISRYLNLIARFCYFPFFKKYEHDIIEIKKVVDIIQKYFPKSSFNHSEVIMLLNVFRVEFYFYNKLFKLTKIEKLIGINGDYKSLFLAAKRNSIISYELQHGDIVESTISCNYQYPEFNKNDNIIYPDYLLLFSDIWSKGKYIPSKCVEIGTDTVKFVKQFGEIKNSICIISSFFHNDVLQKLAIDLALSDSSLKIYFKLHPSQFANFSQQQQYFKKLPNIEVIPINMNLFETMKICDNYVIIYSTTIFELLQSRKIVYILKKLNYLTFKSYFNLPNIYLFDDVKDFNRIRENAFNSTSIDMPDFFKPFNKEAFINLIYN